MRTTYNSYLEMPDGTKIPLMISLPSNFDEKKQYPLTVFLHGNGEFHQGYPNINAMYVQGITKEIKEGKRKDFNSIVVAIQGYSTNKSWWVEQIEYIIALFFGDIKPKANHRSDVIGSFTPLLGIKKYNLAKEIDFMCISQGGQGFSDFLKRYNRLVGTVTLVAAYVTLKASDTAFDKIKKGVEIYHSKNDAVGIWGAEQLADKAKVKGLNSRKVIYPGSSHAIWHTAFADAELYKFHTNAFDEEEEIPVPIEDTPPVEEAPQPVLPPVEEVPPVVETPPVSQPTKPTIVVLKKENFSASNGADVSALVDAIIDGREYPVNWKNTAPFTLIYDLEKEENLVLTKVKDGQGTCAKPNHTTFKTDKGEVIGEFTGGKYNVWDVLSNKTFKTRYIKIENVQETKKNLPIGLEFSVLK